jgi:hypothetical protein
VVESSVVVGSVVVGSVVVGSVVIGSVVEGSVAVGSVVVGSMVIGSVVVGSMAIGSVVEGSVVVGSVVEGSVVVGSVVVGVVAGAEELLVVLDIKVEPDDEVVLISPVLGVESGELVAKDVSDRLLPTSEVVVIGAVESTRTVVVLTSEVVGIVVGSVIVALVLMSKFVAIEDVNCSDVEVDSVVTPDVESNGTVLVAVDVVVSEKAVVVSASVVSSNL